MATTWGLGTTVPSQTTLEDTSRKVTCTDKRPAKVDGGGGYITLSATTGSATRIVDMWHNNTGSSYSSMKLALYTFTGISYNQSGSSFGYSNNYFADNVDIYNFTNKTVGGYVNRDASTSAHTVFAIHKAENPTGAANLYIGYTGNRSNTTSISAEYRRTYSVGYNTWCQYKQNQYISDGLTGAHDYFAITVNAYNQFIVKQYPVYQGKRYTFNLYTQSQPNCDGIIISKAQLTDTDFNSLRNNSNTIAYCSGTYTKDNKDYTPTSNGYVYIYFKTDASILAGKRREQTGYKTTTKTTSGSPGYQQVQVPIYEHYDVYTWGDVDITVTDINIALLLNKCGGSNGDARAYYQPGGTGSPSTAIPSMTDQEDIMDTSIPSKSSGSQNYKFLGYYTSQIGGEQYFDSTGNCIHDIDFVEDTTLYAHWGNTIYNQGTWTNKTIYCTDGAYEASSTIGSKTVNIQADGTTGPNSIHSSNNITYSITDATTISNGFTISNTHRLTIRSGTPAGTYTVRFNIISPGQDGNTPGGYTDDGGYYYFPDSVQKTVTIFIYRTFVTEYKDISIDEYSYDSIVGSYIPPQHTLVPATSYSISINSWESIYTVPWVYQKVAYNNGAIGLKRVENYIWCDEGSGYTASFSNLGTNVLPIGDQRVKFFTEQRRAYVTEDLTYVICNWISNWASSSWSYSSNVSYNSINCSAQLSDCGALDVPPQTNSSSTTSTTTTYTITTTYTTTPHGKRTANYHNNPNHNQHFNPQYTYNASGELVEYICGLTYVHNSDDLRQQLYNNWHNFVTIYDLITYVQGYMSDIMGNQYEPFYMKRDSALRNRNVPTLMVTTPVGTTTLAPGATAYFNVKATYPSGSVENDVTNNCTITTSPTGKITIS